MIYSNEIGIGILISIVFLKKSLLSNSKQTVDSISKHSSAKYAKLVPIPKSITMIEPLHWGVYLNYFKHILIFSKPLSI